MKKNLSWKKRVRNAYFKVMSDNNTDAILYRAELKPRRSAKPRAAVIVLSVLVFFWTVIGGGAAYFGVWPLGTFYGLEFILFSTIIYQFLRTGGRTEYITLTPHTLHVKKAGRYHAEKTFDPYWVRAVSISPDRRYGHIEISSHGESILIGTLLTANECDAVVRDLNAALFDLKGSRPEPTD